MRQPPESVTFVRGLLVRSIAFVALIAFGSLWTQIHGLIGESGILPIGTYLGQVAETASTPWWRAPTLLWLSSGDLSLHLICAAGVLAATAVMLGVAQFPALVALWMLYLSLVVAGQEFMSFQWDVLLLECLVVTMLMAPARLRSHIRDRLPGPAIGIWLMRLLVVKLMVLSAATKLLAFDNTWWQLTALEFHYFTQPLPSTLSWWTHQLPGAVQKFSVATMFVIEFAVPWLVFVGRRSRLTAFFALVALQALIAATGNYGFFNLLSIVICLSLLDDGHFNRLLPLPATRRLGKTSSQHLRELMKPRVGQTIRAAVAVVLVVASIGVSLRELVRTVPFAALEPTQRTWVGWIDRELLDRVSPLLTALGPLRSVNGYGLFRAMTTERPEIVVEVRSGSGEWRELAFKWKPGAIDRRPGQVAPHQPRLDWQMWFAALAPRSAGWLGSFSLRLLEGEPAVWALIDEGGVPDPLPDRLRLRYYDYRFTDRGERESSGAWWRRDFAGELSGEMTAAEIRRRIQ